MDYRRPSRTWRSAALPAVDLTLRSLAGGALLKRAVAADGQWPGTGSLGVVRLGHVL
jgi:hypothetical protein